VQKTSNGDSSKQAVDANKHPDKAANKANAGFSKLFAGAVSKQKSPSKKESINLAQPAASNQLLTTAVNDSNQKRTMSDNSKATVCKSSPFDSKTTKVVSKSASHQGTKVKPETK